MVLTRDGRNGRFTLSVRQESVEVYVRPPECGCGRTDLYRDSGLCETCEEAFGDDRHDGDGDERCACGAQLGDNQGYDGQCQTCSDLTDDARKDDSWKTTDGLRWDPVAGKARAATDPEGTSR